ncbi:hypothetical protein I302_105715 [Kwoniella bestiolae CBS 10118]|uniref:DUF974 domain-containing protein n=1 Tax=Kwoniella bestiolae CBS 10118 TaxID=1296100 RepID=A0A1B9G1Y2_9TREE|nr:hypothetical protein I302_04835 [Kwoniella bestiolae CBS 10118]OCF25025.1 hypothetical protein I302_04835 [Kwoniella bestiolae CBS 10118]
MEPPLTLLINQLSPPSLIPTYIPSSQPISLTDPSPLPSPPREFHFSPTPNYPTPYGNVSLGSTLDLDISLENTGSQRNDVLGVRMMVECQGGSGRYRLGEVIHSNDSISTEGTEGTEPKEEVEEKVDKLSVLKYGERVGLQIDNEIKDLGLNVLIVSVAWETLEGRKTFQRFLKFNVIPPLSIKTRIQTPTNPNTLLSPTKREQVYLEILIQNVSGESMILSKVLLEPVQGLLSHSIQDENEGVMLLPEDIRQFLFVLFPSPSPEEGGERSTFPPSYPGGTILPLGRLDVTWLSGEYHLKGRLQTSTLNRRVPIPTTPAPAPPPKGFGGVLPARTLSSQSNATPGSPLATPNKDRLAGTLLAPSPIKGTIQKEEPDQWEYDLTLVENQDDVREYEVENRFSMGFKLGVRSTRYIHESERTTRKPSISDERKEDAGEDEDDVPLSRISSRVSTTTDVPPPPRIAIQYLTPLPPQVTAAAAAAAGPGGLQISILSPSRTNTPTPAPNDKRPFSPLSGPSRPMTPSSITSQLRQAQTQGLNSVANSPRSETRFQNATPVSFSNTTQQILQEEGENAEEVFPPSPYITTTRKSDGTEGIVNLGISLQILPTATLRKVLENTGQSYLLDTEGEPKKKYKWEVAFDFQLNFIAFHEGLFNLGGLRVLILEDEVASASEGEGRIDGRVGREWISLGDISIV